MRERKFLSELWSLPCFRGGSSLVLHKTVTSENSRDCTEPASQRSGTPLPIVGDGYLRVR